MFGNNTSKTYSKIRVLALVAATGLGAMALTTTASVNQAQAGFSIHIGTGGHHHYRSPVVRHHRISPRNVRYRLRYRGFYRIHRLRYHGNYYTARAYHRGHRYVVFVNAYNGRIFRTVHA